MEVDQPVRAWVAHALTGAIVEEVYLSGASTWTSRFGGGTFQAGVSVGHLKARDGMNLDWGAIQRVSDWCRGGMHSLVLTLGDDCLGEWLMISRGDGSTPDGVLPVGGLEWDGYPALRGIERDLRYTSAPRVQLGATILEECFKQGQPTMQITVPASTGVGSRVVMDHRRMDAYYSDVLEEIADADDGFDWRIVPTVTWANGQPTRVVRTVQFGAPVLARATNIVVDYDGPGFHSGNCVDFNRGFDFSRAAAKVWGAGSGQGDDQITWEATTDELTSQGFVLTSKIVSFPGVKNSEELGFLVRGERDAAKNVHDPSTARVRLEKIPSYPRVGDSVGLDIEPTFSVPSGYTGTMRLGETRLALNGHRATVIEIDGI